MSVSVPTIAEFNALKAEHDALSEDVIDLHERVTALEELVARLSPPMPMPVEKKA